MLQLVAERLVHDIRPSAQGSADESSEAWQPPHQLHADAGDERARRLKLTAAPREEEAGA